MGGDSFQVKARHILVGSLLSVGLVVVIGLLTNEFDTDKYVWDAKFYRDMAESGIVVNDDLRAPYAYRFLAPLIVRAIHTTFDLPVSAGFTLVAYLGTIGQLFAVALLARTLKLSFGGSVVVMLSVAFSYYNVKFLLFDVYRPDQLAFPLLLLAVVALIKRRPVLLMVVTVIGLQGREFLIIPGLMYMAQLWCCLRRDRSLKTLLALAAVVIVLWLAVILPRAWITVTGTAQFVDPLNNRYTLVNLIVAPFDALRNVNLVFVTVGYLLPLGLLVTRGRLKGALEKARPLRGMLCVYCLAVFLLAMYGGTDLGRFVAYLLVPQIILVGYIIEQEVSRVEIGYMLVAVFLFNRVMFEVPMANVEAYHDFYGGFNARVNLASYYRFGELLAYLLGAFLLRWILSSGLGRSSGRAPASESGSS